MHRLHAVRTGCPANAIFPEYDVARGPEHFIQSQRRLSKAWPVLTERKDAPVPTPILGRQADSSVACALSSASAQFGNALATFCILSRDFRRSVPLSGQTSRITASTRRAVFVVACGRRRTLHFGKKKTRSRIAIRGDADIHAAADRRSGLSNCSCHPPNGCRMREYQ